MRESLLPVLRCPRCLGEGTFRLDARERDAREVREGTLACSSCDLERPVRRGIVDLLTDPPGFVEREADGLERFAEVMRADGWDAEKILALPDVDLGYWNAQANAMERMLADVPLHPGQRILDVGSNTCWASSRFAREGLDVVALDIADNDLQGLGAGDIHFEGRGIFFERLLSVMYAPALASGSFDHVFCCEVLHHNDRANLDVTLREMFRLLKPGGRLTVVNEPMRFPLRPKLDHAEEVAQFEGNEHVYVMHQYIRAARAAGFTVRLPKLRDALDAPFDRSFVPPGRLGPLKKALRDGPGGSVLLKAKRAARFWWINAIRGDANLTLYCVKPR
ncbi:class I SAM-dependent methyltransferase [Patulibacter sp.]|uniref:class I SAM-dependent methyltransferase n=1 Tax=Patulibacter sp. TaxID=1912859 RepID=UPI0027187614|nr:class I SAM-dependent methyltransferase [Patulibacter sp.]MDO9408206.1 class I SAM-dependent methyltransferase [Patulibacter sp.]